MMSQQTKDRPFPDPKMEAECLAAFDRGERTTLQQRIDELRSEVVPVVESFLRREDQRPRRYWPGVLVAVLVFLLLGAVLVGQCWGAG